jgi:ABC-2 type transport system ATP-binding protein
LGIFLFLLQINFFTCNKAKSDVTNNKHCKNQINMSYLKAENISKAYYNHIALDDVSIEVPEQSIFGLLGPNGAGKSTLIRIINRIIIEDKGTISLGGKPLTEERVRLIGYLPEERGLYKKMKVGEQMIYLARIKGLSDKEAKANVGEWFERFEITPWWNKKVEDLSKGMQQKLQFIVSVIHQPSLMIFDEPFSGFDPINAEIITKEILRLNQEGATIIFSTHRMETVEALCNHITLINQSKKVLDGTLKDLRKQNRSFHYSVEIENPIQEFEQIINAWDVKNLNKDKDSIYFAFDADKSRNINDYVSELLKIGNLVKFEEKVPTLSDIFINTVTNKNNYSNE